MAKVIKKTDSALTVKPKAGAHTANQATIPVVKEREATHTTAPVEQSEGERMAAEEMAKIEQKEG